MFLIFEFRICDLFRISIFVFRISPFFHPSSFILYPSSFILCLRKDLGNHLFQRRVLDADVLDDVVGQRWPSTSATALRATRSRASGGSEASTSP